VVVLNVVVYLYLEERWGGAYSLDQAFHEVYVSARRAFLGAMFLEFILFAAAIVGLAKFTVHRIAGPYIRLKQAFEEVRSGNLQVRLKFRSYDRLEDVAEAFNQMIASVRKRIEGNNAP
jgi:methyl-accepting chemotaxis protein